MCGMARVLKNPVERRQEIVEISRLLFEKNGYEDTTVQDIINGANIAKGTFYYYFKTKKEVLNEVTKEISSNMYNFIKSIADSTSYNVADKLKMIFVSGYKHQIIGSNIMSAIHGSENRELQESLNIYYINIITPLIAKIFNQGCQQKLWSNEISIQQAQIIFGGTQFILDSGLFNYSVDERRSFITELAQLVEHVIGADRGVIRNIIINT